MSAASTWRAGEFTEVIPVHRLAYTFGWDGREKMPPGSSLVEIDLIDEGGGTLLRMTHSGLPDAEEVAGHDGGLDALPWQAGHCRRRRRSGPGSHEERVTTMCLLAAMFG